jgi:translation initiation factor 6 (eIF-6)
MATVLVELVPIRRMPSSGMLSRVVLVRINVSEERITSIETSVLTRVTRRNIPEDDIVQSQRCENLKSYIVSTPAKKECRSYYLPILGTDL